jgi:class 3 adenylate cyclase
MAAYISTRQALFRLFFSLAIAVLVILAAVSLLGGPRLGPHYDFLLRARQGPRISPELLLIETGASGEGQAAPDNIIEPSVVALVLMTLTELNGSALVVQAPVLGVSGGTGVDEEDLLRRFDTEFTLLERNIRNLFDAIRVGSIPPEESHRYVEDLAGLAERSKERLISGLIHTDKAGVDFFQKAAAAFGNLWEAGDLRVHLVQAGNAGPELSKNRWYSKPRLDPGGVFRRIAPVLRESDAEHILYAALKSRFDAASVEESDLGPRLRLRRDGTDTLLPLDREGALLVLMPRGEEDFKRLPLETFIAYQEADKELYRILAEAETRGFYETLAPEAYPTVLYRYAQELREEMLLAPNPDKRARWLDARKRYFQALEAFFYGPAEMELAAGYDRLLAAENLEEAGAARIIALRDELIASFMNIRVSFGELLETRSVLQNAAAGSICILGSAAAGGGPSDIEASALLANSILTGQVIIPLLSRYVLFWSLAVALGAAFLLRRWGPAATLAAGLAYTGLDALVFIAGFIFTPYWIDPVIPVSGAAAAVFSSFIYALALKHRDADRFRRVYGPIIAPAYLRRLIRARRPPLHETLTAKAAIVAVRNDGFATAENRDPPPASAGAAALFREAVSGAFKNAGATMVGYDGDLALAAFGAPPERAALGKMKNEMPYEDDAQPRGNHSPAAKAVGFLLDLIKTNSEAASWRFGVDTGECAFCYSPFTGYNAFGPAVVRARLLSSASFRYKAGLIVTGAVSEKVEGLTLRRLGALPRGNGRDQEFFYELLINKTAKFALNDTSTPKTGGVKKSKPR